jgi:hypothetical protein
MNPSWLAYLISVVSESELAPPTPRTVVAIISAHRQLHNNPAPTCELHLTLHRHLNLPLPHTQL